MSTRAAAAEGTRARLIEAAIERFAEQGLRASFEAVAADAGVTKGALYHHFGSKEGLVEAVYKEAINHHVDQVLATLPEGSGRERLFALIDQSAALYLSRTPFYRLLIALHLAATTSRPHLAPISRRTQRRQRDFIIGLVRAGQDDGSISPDRDAEAVGLTIYAAVQGFIVDQLEPPDAQRRWVARFRHLMEDIL